MITKDEIRELLRLNEDRLYRREGQELEFKEQFNLATLANYFRDFAAFSNNRGGYLVFGVKDAPRIRIGLNEDSKKQFEKIDPEKITGYLLNIFSAEIRWEQANLMLDGMYFGVFRIWPSNCKPIIARKNEGRGNIIKNGDIYYRYGGRTQKIQSAELENIINHRIEQNNKQWLGLMAKIGRAGPQNAAILDTERALIEKNDASMLVLDEGLASKLNFIKEGEFVEKEGAAALKLVGDVVPVDKVEVVRKIKENLTRSYPLSAKELATAVKKQLPTVSNRDVWNCILENGLKNNSDYSAYNFRNKMHEDNFKEKGIIPGSTPSIYNQNAVEFIVNVLK